jgi:TonB family protein
VGENRVPVVELLAASLMVVPQPSVEQARQIQRAYPARALREKKSAASLIRLRISPAGKVYGCDTLSIAGDTELGQEACAAYLRGKFKFEPPVGAGGQPAHGVVTTIVIYSIPGTRQAQEIDHIFQPPDLAFTVAKLPDRFGKELQLHINVEVATDGQVVACEAAPMSPPDYASVACASLKEAGASVLRGETGQPVPYVARLSVRFTSEAGE